MISMPGSRRRIWGNTSPGTRRSWCNPSPAAAGAGAVQFLYGYGPKDGTLLGIFPETIGLTQLTQPEIGKWKVQEFAYLGSFANVNAVFMMRKDSPAKTIDELRRIETKVGCSSRLREAYINPRHPQGLWRVQIPHRLRLSRLDGIPDGAGPRRGRPDLGLLECVAAAIRRHRRHFAAGHPGRPGAAQGTAGHSADAGAARRSQAEAGGGVSLQRRRDRPRAPRSRRRAARAHRSAARGVSIRW
jgi:hypothetical protein